MLVKKRTETQLKGDVPDTTEAKLYVCGETSCKASVEKEGIRCDSCAQWYHNRCSKLLIKAIDMYARNKFLKWSCPSCIRRLSSKEKVSVGVQTEEFATGENQIKLQDIVQSHAETQTTDTIDITGNGVEHLSGNSPGKSGTLGGNKKRDGVKDTHAEGTKTGATGAMAPKGTRIRSLRKTPASHAKTAPGGGLARTKAPDALDGATTLDMVYRMLTQQQAELDELRNERRELGKTVNTLISNTDVALGRNRNVVIKGIPEPFIKEGKRRAREVRHHVTHLLSLATMPPHVALKRVLRLGKYNGNLGQSRPARPVLVEFANPRHRDKFLAAAGTINSLTKGGIVVQPDDSAAWRQAPKTDTSGEKRAPMKGPVPIVDIERVRRDEETQEWVLVRRDKPIGEKATRVEERDLGYTKPPGVGAWRKLPQPKNGRSSRA